MGEPQKERLCTANWLSWVKSGTGWYLAILIAVSGVGYLVIALLGDLLSDSGFFGRRRNFVLFAIFAIATVFAHFYIPADKTIVLALAFQLGFFASGTFSGTGAFFTELFPTRMRGSGVGFTYNFGRGFAVLILWLIPMVADTDLVQGLWTSLTIPPLRLSLGPSIGVFVLFAYLLVIIAALLLPETKGTVLDKHVEEAQSIVLARPAAAAP